ncbi:nitrous oxide reductase family maturation protein NosD [Chitinophaga sancti]|uniref:Nitrous oxide reductase family maturation protein NosD n=2 Tax=Chitinophaga sancti TaxID=1004 RepID=A0ABZ0XNL9_9BACT|nr:nitrous oxide reductase family maturation protein NosD [Chitinophaga sancti]WQD62258.1 nitrous oxide reductase family maturation protein NosD [Chitinophaga sancti]WQG92173.1 nitrous oxide reductase family maturation protein NosD [Chitinophaga sancti]
MERAISIILMWLLPLQAWAGVWTVKSSVKATLQQAKAGDTVIVPAGVYYEKGLVIDKAIYLKGVGKPVLDGESKYEVVLILSNHVTLEGFVIRHSGFSDWKDLAGIKLGNVRHVTIKNNVLEETFFGIYCQQSDSCVITGNTLKSNANQRVQSGNGIHCWHCDGMQLIGNTVTQHRDGIYFEFVTNSLIKGNHSFKNVRYGLHFMFSHNDHYEDNVFDHNEAGVSVMFSHGVDMKRNRFAGNQGGGAYGILLKEITDSRMEQSHFEDNTVGIYMEGTTRVQVSENVFKTNGWAMKVQASCAENKITHNNFFGNTFDVATNGSLVLNHFDNNYWDKYEGYDLNRDGKGDVPYHPVSLYAMVADKNPAVMMLFHSFMVSLLDRTEKVMPGITPVNLVDRAPFMKPLTL